MTDIYRELASIRAHAQANTFFNALQTGLLAEMDASMQSIHGEIAEARRLHHEGLAAQQEMLQREALQNYLEEFIYQTEKLVAECKKPNTKLPSSSRYFMLLSAHERIKQESISTPIIRGRDNKAAFDRVVGEIKSLALALKQEPEVQEAIRWAQAEQKRLAQEQKQNAVKRRAELNVEITKLEAEVSAMSTQLQSDESMTFELWVERKFSSDNRRSFLTRSLSPAAAFMTMFWLLPKNPDAPEPSLPFPVLYSGMFAMVVLMTVGIWYWIDRSSSGSTVARTQKKLSRLKGQISSCKTELSNLPN